MCDCFEGRVLVTHDREDGSGSSVVNAVRDGQINGVSYLSSMDDVLHSAGREGRLGSNSLHLLKVDAGQEVWAAGQLQFAYQNEFLSAYESGYVQQNDLPYKIFRDPSRHMVATPDSAVGLTQTAPGFSFDPAHSNYLNLLNRGGTTATGRGVEVAVVDTGLDVNGTILPSGTSRSFHDDTTATFVDDVLGHGTAVANVIHDVAPDAELMILKIGDHGRLSEWNLLAAMLYGASADVMNLSVAYSLDARDCSTCGRQQSHSSRSSLFERVLRDVAKINPELVVVAAAGNRTLPELDYPARFSNVIAVGAIDSQLTVAPYSNTGAVDETGQPHQRLYFAPGGVAGEFIGHTITRNGKRIDHKGTSFAAPYASGLFATFLETHPAHHARCGLAYFKAHADQTIAGYSAAVHGNGIIRI